MPEGQTPEATNGGTPPIQVGKAETSPKIAEALTAELMKNPALGDVLNVVMTGGTPTPEQAAKLFKAMGMNRKDALAAFPKAAKALEESGGAKPTKAAPSAAPAEAEVEEAPAAPARIPLVEALNRTMVRLQKAVRETFPEEIGLMIVVAHTGIQVAPVLPSEDGKGIKVIAELDGVHKAKVIGEAIEVIITEVGLQTGAIEEADEDDDDEDDEDDDE